MDSEDSNEEIKTRKPNEVIVENSPEKLKILNKEGRKHKLHEDSKIPEKKSRMDYLDNPREHPSSGLRRSFHGIIYQLKLSMLFMSRGLKLKRRFRLATEFDPGEKFDDIFFEYEKEIGDGSIIRVVQAKHKQDSSKTISLADLITETDGEFSLQKYFISYRKIIKHPDFTRKDTELKDLIIFTNIGLHKDLKVNFEPVVGSGDILDMTHHTKEAQLLKFKNNFPIKSEIESIFKNTSESIRLAKKIAKCNKLDLNDELLRVYHGVLAKDVFDITENKTECYSTFRENFLDLSDNNKTEGLIHLRDNFFSYLNKKGKLNLVELKRTKIPTSRSFGKVFKLNGKDSEEFAKEFAASVKLAQNNIVEILRTNKTIKDNINELAGYLLIKKDDSENDIYFLSSAFFDDNCPLPSELTLFRSNLKAALQNEGIIVNKDQYKFKISKYYTCYDDEIYTKASLPDDYVTDEEIKEFLNKLVFAVNQPNEVELGKIIATEVLADVNVIHDFIVEKFQSYMLNWMKKKEGTFLTLEDVKKFFKESKSELHKLMFIGITCDYLAKIDTFCLTFNENAIKSLQMRFNNFLNSDSNKQILNIFTENTQLCSIKIYQIIKKLVDYKTRASYIFLNLSTLVRLEDKLLMAFDSHTTKLLIIANDNAKNDNDHGNLLKLLDKLKPILNENSNLKIIIIGSSERILLNNAEFNNDKYNLNDLTLESQEKILAEGIISFQGHNIDLNKLRNEKLHNVIDGNILLNLIHKQEIKDGAELPNLNEISKYYITRSLKRFVHINQDFQQNTQKFFIVDNYKHPKNTHVTEPNDFQDIILISDNSDNEFKDLCTKYNGKNIHWLKEDEQKIIWKQSSGGDLSKLRDFINKYTVQHTEPKIATDISEKVDVIVAEPGMGKSTLLTYLALQTKKSEPALCILKINLIDNAERFQSWPKKRTPTEMEINEFLYSCYFNKTNEESIKALEKNVFDFCYEQGKIIVMFDGFDEISPDYKIVVLKMLKVLKNTTIGGMWITTRPYNIQSEIENVLGTFSYTLQLISKEQQIYFLKSYWAQNLKGAEIDDELIEKFLKWFSKITNDKYNNFVTIPLQLRMIAEIFQNIFEELIKSGNHELSKNYEQMFGDKLNLVNLYEKFIDIKFNKILIEEKITVKNTAGPFMNQIIEEKRTEFLSNHKKFALLSLFGTDELKILSIEIGDLVADINKGKEKTGIIDRVIDEKPIFVHKSYAEYFAALWLVDNWKENKVNSFLIEHIFKEENKGIRSFFDYLLAYENNTENNEDEPKFDNEYQDSEEICSPMMEEEIENECDSEFQKSEEIYNPLMENKFALHTYVLKNDRKNLQRLLLEQRNSHEVINAIDKGGRTALHLMSSYHYTETLKSVMSAGIKFDINKKDKLFGWSPLIYAEKSGSWNIAEMLLSAEADNDEMFKTIDNINGIYMGPNNLNTEIEMTLLHIATSQGLLNLTKVLIKKGSDVYTRDEMKRSTLHLAASNGNEIIVEFLINHEKQTNSDQLWDFINMKDEDDYTALDYAVKNDLTKIVILLIKIVEEKRPDKLWEFINEKSELGHSSLHISAINGHTKVVEHLLKLVETKFPEKMFEFINAKQENDYNALHIAAEGGKTAVVEILLKFVEKIKPDQVWDFINEINEFGDTSLHISAYNGHTEVAEHLLKLVETKFPEKMLEFITAKQKDGFTALHLAARKGKTEVVEVLLKFVEKIKPDQVWDFINAKNEFGDTSLHISAYNGHTEVAEHLLKLVETKCPEKMLEFITAKQKDGFTALHLAARKGKTEVVKVLLKFVEKIKPDQVWDFINAKNEFGGTSLHFSVRNGHTEVVEHLLKLVETKFPEKMFEFINAKQKNGFTALHLAARKGKTEVVKVLLKFVEQIKPDQVWDFINEKTEFGDSSLHISAHNGHKEVAEHLLELVETKFPENLLDFIITKNKNGFTVLHLAAYVGKTDVVEVLLKFVEKIKPDQVWDFIKDTDEFGDTSLHISAHNGHKEVAELLLKLVETKFPENLLDFIITKNKNGFTVLHLAAYVEKTDVVEVLLKFVEKIKPDQVWDFINAKNEFGGTSLHISAFNGHTEVAEYLLELVETKFPKKMLEFINTKENDGCTALHLAAHEGKTAVVKDKQKDGFTALHLVAYEGKPAVVEVLLKFVKKMKPDQVWDFINEKNEFGDTSLHLCASNGHKKVVEHLLKLVEMNFPEKMLEFINAKQKKDFTALDIATLHGKTDIVQVLLKFEEKINTDQF